jgi:hypothetical protein
MLSYDIQSVGVTLNTTDIGGSTCIEINIVKSLLLHILLLF